MEKAFEFVEFITVESEDDWIVSFFADGRSIILMRDKKWEALVPESEKGVKVSDGRIDDESWENNRLLSIRLEKATADIQSELHLHRLDLRRVVSSEILSAGKTLKKMNFDRRFKLSVG